MTKHFGPYVRNRCQWAALLGNVGDESAGLTTWTEIGCPPTYNGYCGRGPLQITGIGNYEGCSKIPMCNCPGIVTNPEEAATNPDIGMSSSACMWENSPGDLSQYADGTEDGFHRTACAINAGRPSTTCALNGWQDRLSYWHRAQKFF